MRFAHLADCHIGGWRDPTMRDLSIKAFAKAVSVAIEKKLDFVLISGDLFNTSFPNIDNLKQVFLELKRLKEEDIPVYLIPGSHDFSASGKTMLDLLDLAGLAHNVYKAKEVEGKLRLEYSEDKSGAMITGSLGLRGMLERGIYTGLDRSSLDGEGFRIFMFHTALTEMKPDDMQMMASSPISMLPAGFDYYAGGHVHVVMEKKVEGYGPIVFPGPLFPNNFREMEKLGTGGFYIYEDGELYYHELKGFELSKVIIECDSLSAEDIEKEILSALEKDLTNHIVTIRLFGTMEGKPSDIDFRSIYRTLYSHGALFVMKNMNKLQSEKFEDSDLDHDVDDIESRVIEDTAGTISIGLSEQEEVRMSRNLMKALSMEKDEGERSYDFEKRLIREIDKIIP